MISINFFYSMSIILILFVTDFVTEDWATWSQKIIYNQHFWLAVVCDSRWRHTFLCYTSIKGVWCTFPQFLAFLDDTNEFTLRSIFSHYNGVCLTKLNDTCHSYQAAYIQNCLPLQSRVGNSTHENTTM